MKEQTIVSLAITLCVCALTILYVGFWVRHDDMSVCKLQNSEESCVAALR